MTDAPAHATTDLSDDHPDALVCDPVFQAFGGRPAFSGPVTTLKVFEDNVLVRAAVEQPGEGRVLVVDGGGSLRCALLGGKLAVLGAGDGWAGGVGHRAGGGAPGDDAPAIGLGPAAPPPPRHRKGPNT